MAGTKKTIIDNRHNLLFCGSCWTFSQILLNLVAWFAAYYPGNGIYQRYIDRGYFLSPKWWIDIWCRWDSQWHFSIVQNGYLAPETLGEGYSNMAFFPLYPSLIRLLTFWLPARFQTESVYLLAGLILSNLCLILALYGMMRLAQIYFGQLSEEKAVLLFLCLPAAFFFRSFYSEGLFLFLTVFAFLSAKQEHWRTSAIFAALAALTRPHGVLILLPIFWLYFKAHDRSLAKIGKDWLWYLLVPAAVAGFFFTLYLKTGDYFAFFKAQAAWGRSVGILSPAAFFKEYTDPLFTRLGRPATLDLVFISVSLILSILLLIRKPEKELGIYALASVLTLILTGNLFSMTRYTAAIFPIWLFAADRLKNRYVFSMCCITLAVFQGLLFCGWVNFYWIA